MHDLILLSCVVALFLFHPALGSAAALYLVWNSIT